MFSTVLGALLFSSVAQDVSPDTVAVRLRPEKDHPARFLVAQDINPSGRSR